MKKTKIIALFLVLAMVLTSTVFIVSAEDSENAALNDALKEYYGDTDFELHIHDDSCCSDADFDNFDNWEDFNLEDFIAIQIDDSGDTFLVRKDYVAEVGEEKAKEMAENIIKLMMGSENDEQAGDETKSGLHIKGSIYGIFLTNVNCNYPSFMPCMGDVTSVYYCATAGHSNCYVTGTTARVSVKCYNGIHTL